MKLIEEWAQAGSPSDMTWVAAAETHADVPVITMVATRMAEGYWKGLVEYRDGSDCWSDSPFDTRCGAQHWCEQTAETLAGGQS
jgi:hypothetical protein